MSAGEIPREPLFRPSKRRKVFSRRRSEGEDDAPPASTASPPRDSSHNPPSLPLAPRGAEDQGPAPEDTGLSVAEIVKRRKLNKTRKGGIEFSKSKDRTSWQNGAPKLPDPMGAQEEARTAVDIAASRFAPQTGLIAETTNTHMTAYIDAKMNELRKETQSESQSTLRATGSTPAVSDSIITSSKSIQRQPAGLGRLQEIDLGPDTTLKNIARTEAALEGGQLAAPEEKLGKVRLGRDGKPWRSRKRRNSEDIRRDQLVEDVLRESRLDIYEEPDEETDNAEDRAADDRIADQFRREFLDALSSRNNKKKPPVGKDPKADKIKGPKLGGSRNARAAMHRAQEDSTKKK